LGKLLTYLSARVNCKSFSLSRTEMDYQEIGYQLKTDMLVIVAVMCLLAAPRTIVPLNTLFFANFDLISKLNPRILSLRQKTGRYAHIININKIIIQI